jgi:23S rRNA A1618 N6-methylase RlmF
MTEVELERLHHATINRRYDLRVCNPAHGPFYGFMADYSAHADDRNRLLELAEVIEDYRSRSHEDAETLAAYGQLVMLARWRAAQVGTPVNVS